MCLSQRLLTVYKEQGYFSRYDHLTTFKVFTLSILLHLTVSAEMSSFFEKRRIHREEKRRQEATRDAKALAEEEYLKAYRDACSAQQTAKRLWYNLGQLERGEEFMATRCQMWCNISARGESGVQNPHKDKETA